MPAKRLRFIYIFWTSLSGLHVFRSLLCCSIGTLKREKKRHFLFPKPLSLKDRRFWTLAEDFGERVVANGERVLPQAYGKKFKAKFGWRQTNWNLFVVWRSCVETLRDLLFSHDSMQTVHCCSRLYFHTVSLIPMVVARTCIRRCKTAAVGRGRGFLPHLLTPL